MRDSRITVLAALAIVLFSRQYWPDSTLPHELFELAGYALIAACVLGRLYTTAFLGGFKNRQLIDCGPFSVMRNPLYFFSLLGVTGAALMSNHPLVMIGLPAAFLAILMRQIRREERFLATRFGDDYRRYVETVPRLWPRLAGYRAPDSIAVSTRVLASAVADAVWWFVPLPLIELIEYAQQQGYLPIVFG
ncbi:MAG TPA: isoprenylcysteine carboxylmethyltransferase family protein [Alphaproteobacteria bacterium]